MITGPGDGGVFTKNKIIRLTTEVVSTYKRCLIDRQRVHILVTRSLEHNGISLEGPEETQE